MRDEMDDDNYLSAPENVILLLCLQYEQLVELLDPSLLPRRTPNEDVDEKHRENERGSSS